MHAAELPFRKPTLLAFRLRFQTAVKDTRERHDLGGHFPDRSEGYP